jgi:hypothetical protein
MKKETITIIYSLALVTIIVIAFSCMSRVMIARAQGAHDVAFSHYI